MATTEEELAREAFIQKLPYKLPCFEDWSPEPNFYHPLMAGSIDGTDIEPHDRAVVRAMRSEYRPNKKVNFVFYSVDNVVRSI